MKDHPFSKHNPESQQIQGRQKFSRVFQSVTFTPVIIALFLIAALLFDTFSDTLSWQVVQPDRDGTGKSYPVQVTDFFDNTRVLKLELQGREYTEEEIQQVLTDKEEARRFEARNRMELMWYTQDGPMRWVFTTLRDERISDHNVFYGFSHLQELKASLQEGEQLRLNPWLDWTFLTRDPSRTPLMAGVRVAVVGTLWILTLTLLFSIPVGVGTAIYLEEYASKNRISRLIEVNLRNLAGVPSILYGILGLAVFVRTMHMGPSVLPAALTLSLLVMPTVVIAAREAIRSVPDSMRQASYGLGATRWQTVSRVVLPGSIGGITTGVILAAARAIGEAAPLLMVGAAAYVPFAPNGLFSEYTVMPVQIYSWIAANQSEFANVAAAGIVVLLLILSVLYMLAFYVRNKFAKEY